MSLSFFLIPVLPLLFVRELGWTVEEFNVTKGGLILVFTMLGYLAGGQLGRRFGGKSVIIYGALFTALTTSLWGMSESMWSSGSFMMVMWSIRTFAWGLVTINIYSLVMRVTWSEVGGTQFTAYMAMMNVSSIIGYQLTDPISSRYDYPTLFLIAAVLETFVIFGALFIDPAQTRRELAHVEQG
jgi:MFS family permease